MKKIIVKQENQEQRIDRFLKEGFFCNEDISRGEIARLIKDGKILVNQKTTKPSHVLKIDDEILITDHGTQNTRHNKLVPNFKVKFKVVFENENFIIIEKPAGLKVHSSGFEEKKTLANGLVARFPEIENVGEDPLRPGIVHRLDKNTSGLMIVAKNQKSFEEFKEKFKNKKIEKAYVALVHGHLENKKGTIEKPIARASSYKKQVVAGKKTKTKVRPAVTEFKVLKSFAQFDLVEVRPKTGRMHQIRVHFLSLEHPLVGDEKYKLKKFPNPKNLERHLLHAQGLKFDFSGENFQFFSPLPEIFENIKI